MRQLVGEYVMVLLQQCLSERMLWRSGDVGVGLRLHEQHENLLDLPPAVSPAESLDRDGGEPSGTGYITDALDRLDVARWLSWRSNLNRAILPSDDHIVSGEPGHAEDGIVTLQRRGGERGRERDQWSTLRRSQCERYGDLAMGRDDGTVGESDGAVRGCEYEAAAARVVRVNEFRRCTTVNHERGWVSIEESSQFEQIGRLGANTA
jgi:hypothetical protein